MLYSILKKNSYQDSVNLMLLSARFSKLPGVRQVSAMMGTPPNKAIMRNTGMLNAHIESATPNDICIAIEADRQDAVAVVEAELEAYFSEQTVNNASSELVAVKSWDSAIKQLPGANMALFSIPGGYVRQEAMKALNLGLNVFIFSDNVSLDDEYALKTAAQEKNLLVMGPDCGTGIIQGVPVAFANVVSSGPIGVVAASGTGLQEITTLVDRYGAGISQAIGTGGRDLSEKIGGITMLAALDVLAADPATEVIVVASKPPAHSVKERIISKLQTIGKPAVAIFLGEKPASSENNLLHFAYTLEDAARMAVKLCETPAAPCPLAVSPEAGAIIALYAGGTLAGEAAMLMQEAAGADAPQGEKSEQVMWRLGGHQVYDLGDDCYTQGRPHPMIDPTQRLEFLRNKALESTTRVILFDLVLGYGGNPQTASLLAEAITEIRSRLAEQKRSVLFVAVVCGTAKDPQGYAEQSAILTRAGVMVKASNAEAVRYAIRRFCAMPAEGATAGHSNPLFSQALAVVNVGLQRFAQDLTHSATPVVQYDWKPVAGGDERLISLLAGLE